jgi:hypothetical protein
MLTRESLDALKVAVKGLSTPARLREVQASTKLVATLGAAEAAPAKPSEDIMAQLRSRILAAIRAGGLTSIAPNDLRDAAWLLWDAKAPMVRLQPLLLDGVVDLAARRISARRSLIEAWLRDFAPRLPGIAPAGKQIRQLLATVVDARMEIWRRADREVKLFEADEGPRELALRLLNDASPVSDVLAGLGFADPIRANGGYMRQVHAELLMVTPDAIQGSRGATALPRILDFLTLDGKLRFCEPEQRGAVARGLLGAWLEGGPEPSGDLALNVQRYLLEHLKDPRVAPQNWQTAGDEARAKIRQWLTKASLKAFFGLIGEHAKDEHWEFRGAFWEAYLDHGAISDAWLALGANTHHSAKSVPDLGGAYGKLVGAGSDQSVLLIRIGDVVFCEWSHNGKLRAWSADWKNAPRLGLPEYRRDEITGAGLPFPPNPHRNKGGNDGTDGISHFNSKEGYWQGSAAELIRRRPKISLTFDDWMPRQYRKKK